MFLAELRQTIGEVATDSPLGGGLAWLELPEDLVLPYEITQPGFIPRKFWLSIA